MTNLTTPQAILCGFALIALAIASLPYSSNIVTLAHANTGIQKVAICDPEDTHRCVDVMPFDNLWPRTGSMNRSLPSEVSSICLFTFRHSVQPFPFGYSPTIQRFKLSINSGSSFPDAAICFIFSRSVSFLLSIRVPIKCNSIINPRCYKNPRL